MSVTAALIAAFMMLSVLPAEAAVYSASTSGAEGSVDFVYTGYKTMNFNKRTLKDIKCDSNDVFMEIWGRVGQNTQQIWKKYNSAGCNSTSTWADGSYNPTSGTIWEVWVRVCTDDALTNTCNSSTRYDNPYS